jgi:enoyl-CoA hydratase
MAAKESVNRSFESGLSDGVMFERRCSTPCSPPPTRRKAWTPFLNKRKAAFTHR